MSAFVAFILLIFHHALSQTFNTLDCDQPGTNCNTQIISANSGGTVTHTFNCRNAGDCNNLVLYHGDKGSLIINCWGTNSCNNTQIYVGDFDPPGLTYDASNMNGNGISATVYCSDPDACINVHLSCKGDGINLCSLFADSGTDPIQSSTVECNIGSGTCEFDCEQGCYGNNNLLCHTGSSCICTWSCSSVTQINDVTYNPTPFPTVTPTNNPTMGPTMPGQTRKPSVSPTDNPTNIPTQTTNDPTTYPSETPTKIPSVTPTIDPTKKPSDNPTESPTDYAFCTNNDDNINAGFITLNNKWSNVICEFCVCRDYTISNLICDTIDFNNLKSYDSYLIDTFMQKCQLDQECSFKQVGLKRPSEDITTCNCDLFQCNPQANNGNTFIFGVLVVLEAIIVMFSL